MKQSGFTLIELIIAVAIVGVLAAVGIPSFQDLVKENRLGAQQRLFLSAINLARSEASHRNQVVTISSVGGASWDGGLQIYTDADAAGNTAFSAGTDTLIKAIDAPESDILNIRSDGDNFISFRGNGMLNEGGNSVTLAFCDDRGAGDSRAITISLVGRATVTVPAASCNP